MEAARPQYSFHHVGQDGLLYVFEAPIDLLSFLTLYPDRWQEHSYVALCGTGGQAVCWMLGSIPASIRCALSGSRRAWADGGQAPPGRVTGSRIPQRYPAPVHKDWNDDLVQGRPWPALQ